MLGVIVTLGCGFALGGVSSLEIDKLILNVMNLSSMIPREATSPAFIPTLLMVWSVSYTHLDVYKRQIHTQILTVFFLPLITAGIHVMFAYPIIRAILRAMMLSSETVFITCTVASFLVFSVLYAVVYALTAKVYYRIISEDNK